MKRGITAYTHRSRNPGNRSRTGLVLLAIFTSISTAYSLAASAGESDPADELFDLPRPQLRVFAASPYSSRDISQVALSGEPAEGLWNSPSATIAVVPINRSGTVLGFALVEESRPGTTWGGGERFGARAFAWQDLSSPDPRSTVGSGLAARVGDLVQIGAGLQLGWSDIALLRNEGKGRIQVNGDDMSLSGTVGLTLSLNESHHMGVSYHVPLDMDYVGEFPLDPTTAASGGGLFRSDMQSHIKNPVVLGALYGIELSDRIEVEAMVEWLQYSKIKDLPLMAANGLPGLPGSVNENWRDSFSMGIAGAWRLGPHWVARTGYQFLKSPVPDSNLPSVLPDADQNMITASLSFNYGNHAIQATYGADFYATRHASTGQNPMLSAPGLGTTTHLVSVTYHLVF